MGRPNRSPSRRLNNERSGCDWAWVQTASFCRARAASIRLILPSRSSNARARILVQSLIHFGSFLIVAGRCIRQYAALLTVLDNTGRRPTANYDATCECLTRYRHYELPTSYVVHRLERKSDQIIVPGEGCLVERNSLL